VQGHEETLDQDFAAIVSSFETTFLSSIKPANLTSVSISLLQAVRATHFTAILMADEYPLATAQPLSGRSAYKTTIANAIEATYRDTIMWAHRSTHRAPDTATIRRTVRKTNHPALIGAFPAAILPNVRDSFKPAVVLTVHDPHIPTNTRSFQAAIEPPKQAASCAPKSHSIASTFSPTAIGANLSTYESNFATAHKPALSSTHCAADVKTAWPALQASHC
jgi:hypothetical protein